MQSPQTSVSSPELPIPPAAAIAVQFSVVVDPVHGGRRDRFVYRDSVAAGFEDLRDGDSLIIGLTEVTFLASHGLQVLIEATQDAQERRIPLGIVSSSGLFLTAVA
jgi:hypothetical protein